MFHKDVVGLLRQSPPKVRLVVHRPSEPIFIPSDSSPSPKNGQESIRPASLSSALISSSLFAMTPEEQQQTLMSIQESKERTPTPVPTKEETSRLSTVDSDVSLVEVFGEKLLGRVSVGLVMVLGRWRCNLAVCGQVFKLELSRGVKGLGFSVTSGARSATDDSLILGCFIRVVVADPALSDRRLKSGDQLLKV